MAQKKKGIDVSVWQGAIDAVKIKNSGIEFVIMREGYRQTVDKRFFENVKKCQETGIEIPGVYHFIYALNVEQAKQEAISCVENVKKAGLGKGTIIFSDFEYDTVTKAAASGVKLGRTECNAFTKAFCETVESFGYKAGIYFNVDYYKNWYDHDLLNKYVRWLADWYGKADYPCVFHQYSSKGSVPGIIGDVDMNYFLGEETAWKTETKPVGKEVETTMNVRIGHASISENRTTSGKPGDQTGKEVCIRDWYSKPWDFMAIHPDVNVRDKHAKAVEAACRNDNIGYNWYGDFDRNSLNRLAKEVGYDLSKVGLCNCDCSSLQNVAAVASGSGATYGSNGWTTSTMRNALKNLGYKIVTDATYLKNASYCVRGAIYVKTSAHTVCGLDNGVNYSKTLAAIGISSRSVAFAKKSVEEIAKEVMAGKWGSGQDRRNRLTAAGYDYSAVQKRVNELM